MQEQLKKATSWAHPQGSAWLIDTTNDCSWWRDTLKKVADANDEFLIARLKGEWATSNMDKDALAWLNSPSRRW